MKVKILAHTPEPEKVIAMAGKLCYSPSDIDTLEDNLTEDNINSFVNRLVSMGHESPLEHVSFTFGIEGVSRSLTHQLVRHRLASYSQKSQRYVEEGQFEYIVPKVIEENPEAAALYELSMEQDQSAYDKLVDIITNDLLEKEKTKLERDLTNKEFNALQKVAYENARYVLPNACETKIIVTMNIRSLFNFFEHRCCNRAQDEIRDLADEMLRQCREVAPVLFTKAGASCEHGKCPEGAMSCGSPRGDKN